MHSSWSNCGICVRYSGGLSYREILLVYGLRLSSRSCHVREAIEAAVGKKQT